MYGKTYDDFTYRGVEFRWTLSDNRKIYVVRDRESLGIIGTIPASLIKGRQNPEAIEQLYPVCDVWLEGVTKPNDKMRPDSGTEMTGIRQFVEPVVAEPKTEVTPRRKKRSYAFGDRGKRSKVKIEGFKP